MAFFRPTGKYIDTMKIFADIFIGEPRPGCYAGFWIFFGGGESKHGFGTQNLYFVCCHGYLKKGAFAGVRGGAAGPEDKVISKIL